MPADTTIEDLDNPVVVPVHFMGTFNSYLDFGVTLNGVTASETNDVVSTCNDAYVDPFYWTMSTPEKEAYLAIYKTYALTLWGSNVYSAILGRTPTRARTSTIA